MNNQKQNKNSISDAIVASILFAYVIMWWVFLFLFALNPLLNDTFALLFMPFWEVIVLFAYLFIGGPLMVIIIISIVMGVAGHGWD